MRTVALAFVVTLGTVTALAHPFFRFCDSRAARRRLTPRKRAVRRRPDDGVEHLCARLLRHMARSVRNGQSSVEALSLAVLREPRSAEWFAPVAVAHAEGTDLVAATSLLADAPPPVRRAAAQIGVSAAAGSPRAASLDRAAELLCVVAGHREDARAASAQVRLSLRVLSVLPALTVAGALVLQDSARSVLSESPSLVISLVAAAGLNVAGRSWMRRLAAEFR